MLFDGIRFQIPGTRAQLAIIELRAEKAQRGSSLPSLPNRCEEREILRDHTYRLSHLECLLESGKSLDPQFQFVFSHAKGLCSSEVQCGRHSSNEKSLEPQWISLSETVT